MTERQKELINYLSSRGWVTQKAIYNALQELYEMPKGRNFHDTATRMQIAKDIRQINESAEPYVILSSNIGIKLANEKEAEILIKKNISSTLNKLNREKRKLKKLNDLYGEENVKND